MMRVVVVVSFCLFGLFVVVVGAVCCVMLCAVLWCCYCVCFCVVRVALCWCVLI